MAEELKKVIALIRSGDKTAAQKLLIQILKKEPNNEVAWFWLVEALPTVPDKIAALRECLKFNPESLRARKALEKFQARQQFTPRTLRLPEPPDPDNLPPPVIKEPLPVPSPAEQETQPRQKPRHSRRAIWIGVTVFLFLAGAAAILAWQGYLPAFFSGRPQAEALNLGLNTTLASPSPGQPPVIVPGTPIPRSFASISLESAGDVKEIARWGAPVIHDISWMPPISPAHAGQLVLANSSGIYFSDPGTLLPAGLLVEGRSVSRIAVSPDGKIIAAALYDYSIQLFNSATGSPARTLRGHTGLISALGFSPDGKILASAAQDQTARLWDWQSGTERAVLAENDTPVDFLAYSPDNRYIATASQENKIFLWDAKTGRMLYRWSASSGTVTGLCFTPDNRYLVVVLPAGIIYLDITGNETQASQYAEIVPKAPNPKGANDARNPVFTADGNWLVISAGNTLYLFNAQNLKEPPQTITAGTGEIERLALSSEGVAVDLRAGGNLEIWPIEAGDNPRPIQAFANPVAGVAFSPDGNTLVAGRCDGNLQVWNLPSNILKFTLGGLPGCPDRVVFSSDGNYLAAAAAGEGGNQAFKIWNLTNGREPKYIQSANSQSGLAFSSDNRMLWNGLRPWNLDTFEPKLNVKLPAPSGNVKGIRFSLDSTRLAVLLTGNQLALWQYDGQNKISLLAKVQEVFKEPVSAFDLNPQGDTLVATGSNGTIAVWDVPTGQALLTWRGHITTINSLAFSPDGNILATGAQDGLVILWDLSDGKRLISLQGHTEAVTGLVFSPDGEFLVSSSSDGSIRLWGVLHEPEAGEASAAITTAVP